MGRPRYSTDEIVARGKEIYEQKLRQQLEAQNPGRFLVIDIETGAYAMDEDELAASGRAARKKPDGARFGMRIGSPTSGTLGNGDLTDLIPADWLAEFEAVARRPLETRLRYAFIHTYKPVLDDAPYRAFDTLADYRQWCQENLPDWLGYGR